MLWRAQRIPQCSLHWNKLLSRPPAPSAPTPLSLLPCSRTFVWTLRKRQDTGVIRYTFSSSPARVSGDDDSETVPISPKFFYHSQLQTTGVPPHGISENEIKVAGLIQSIRKQKKATFAQVSDGSTLEPFQAVLSPEQATGITNGAYVLLAGVWQKSLGKGQSHELHVRRVEAIGPSDPEQNPIQKKYQSLEYLRTLPHLRIRVPFHSLVARARGTLTSILTQQFAGNGAVQVHPPIITSSDCEGAGEVFAISPQTAPSSAAAGKESSQYFREPKYLTVSSQLHLEAYSAELGDVFALSPTFRAEESDTPRHLSEFYMLEVEYRRIEKIKQLCKLVEQRLTGTVRSFRESQAGRELLQYYAEHKSRGAEGVIDLGTRWSKLEAGRLGYRRILHQSAVRELLEADAAHNGTLFKTKPTYTAGLQLEHERWIVENVGTGAPVFVLHYPKSAKPFYMLPSTAQMAPPHECSESGVETVACFDLLLPFNYGEVAGGSLREHRLDNLISTMRQRGMLKQRDPSKSKQSKDSQPYPFLQPDEDLGNLKWYADLRRFGTSPHGGFGLGFDRLLAYLVGVSNVRDVVAFPRTWRRADC
jgi:asparaginyl-tRNA synthetase